jgi:hypothetical protein
MLLKVTRPFRRSTMYQLGDAAVTKRVESWKLIVPLHNNDGHDFDQGLIESITQGIVSNFPGLTAINCVGHWREGHQTYKDRNLELIIDVAPTDSSAAESFFAKYKADLAVHLQQSKIYLTREQSKTEVITYDEFFREVGLEISAGASDADKRRVAQSAIENVDFVVARMGYETTLLRRDDDRKVIIWERKVCGMQLSSEIRDDPAPDTRLIAADRIDHYVEWMKNPTDILVVGDWESQKFILSGRPFTPLVEAEVPKGIDFKLPQYLSQQGEPISHKRFIEEFTMAIICGVMTLRDEGFLPHEIALTVGSDGSAQWSTDSERRIVFFCPAPIPDKPIQHEILRCVRIALEALSSGTLSPLGLQQAKALHRYVFKRGAVRCVLQEKPR